MRNIYTQVFDLLKRRKPLALATIIEAEGSTPQIKGASALFSEKGLLQGTLGGGLVEAKAEKRALQALKKGICFLYEISLSADISEEEGAICGGKVIVLIDAFPLKHRETFRNLKESLLARQSGLLVTQIENPCQKKFSLSRYWIKKENDFEEVQGTPLSFFREEIRKAASQTSAQLIKKEKSFLFLEPQFPWPQLVIAGAGHIGQAIAHLGSLLNFEVTVIDDRPEFANRKRFPESDSILVDNIGKAIRKFPINLDTYVVIVTRGHSFDAGALRECIGREAAYIGMIGSKRKVSLMRERFLEEGWATAEQFDRVHAPIGLDIGSKTVEEIAVSIAAELILVRQQRQEQGKEKA